MDFTISSQPKRIASYNNLSVKIYQDEGELAQDAAQLAQNHLKSLMRQQEVVRVVLATGNSQIKFLQALTAIQELDWSRIVFFHLDEYLGIEANNPASFRYYLKHKVAQKIPAREFHYLQGDALQPLEECYRYGQLLQQKPIDLCLLGLGHNGHLAFNEPTVADFTDSELVKLVKLEDITRQQQVGSNSFTDVDNVPKYAYTMTIPAICSAKQIFCLVPGKNKARIVNQMLTSSIKVDCPASILRKQQQAILFLDRDSASLL